MCFDLWPGSGSGLSSLASVPPVSQGMDPSAALTAPRLTTAAEVKEVLDHPPQLVRRVSSLCKELILVKGQLAFFRSEYREFTDRLSDMDTRQSDQSDQLAAVKARQDDQSASHEALSQRVGKLEQRFEGFDDSLKDALVYKF